MHCLYLGVLSVSFRFSGSDLFHFDGCFWLEYRSGEFFSLIFSFGIRTLGEGLLFVWTFILPSNFNFIQRQSFLC